MEDMDMEMHQSSMETQMWIQGEKNSRPHLRLWSYRMPEDGQRVIVLIGENMGIGEGILKLWSSKL